MRIGKTDKFWVVTDAGRASELVDVMFETTIEGLERQFKGGLTSDHNPTIFTSAEEAESEAYVRLAQAKAIEAIHLAGEKRPFKKAASVQIKDADGKTIYEAKL